MHLADAFIQSDLPCIQAIHFFVGTCYHGKVHIHEFVNVDIEVRWLEYSLRFKRKILHILLHKQNLSLKREHLQPSSICLY